MIDLPAQVIICEGDGIEIGSSIPYAVGYLWNTGDTSATINVAAPGEYSVEVFFPGCSETATIEILTLNIPDFELGEDKVLCESEGYTLAVESGNFEVLWSTGATTSSILTDETNLYAVTISQEDCAKSDSIYLSFFTYPFVDLGEDTVLCLNQHLVVHTPAQPGIHYLWQNGTAQDSFVITESGIYRLLGYNSCGESSDVINVEIENCHAIYIPNVFSPNGDGINDFFNALGGSEGLQVLSLKIFGRWGEMVFYEENFKPDTSTGWDGNFRGKKVHAGVYTYLMKVKFKDDQEAVFNGDITLLR